MKKQIAMIGVYVALVSLIIISVYIQWTPGPPPIPKSDFARIYDQATRDAAIRIMQGDVPADGCIEICIDPEAFP